ncbi:general substrate transporter [Aspergillus insuetus]
MSSKNDEMVDQTNFIAQARVNDADHLSLKDAMKLYKKGILWSLAISLGPIMEGYDVVLLGSFYGLTPFVEKYGTPEGIDSTMAISSAWQSAISCGSLAGCVIGLTFSALVAERLGYRTTLLISLALKCAFVFLTFFAHNIGTIVAGSVLMGIPWGILQVLPLTYMAEVVPLKLRGYMTSYINLCLVTGQLISSGVVRGFSTRNDQWAYRVPLALQWAWVIPVLLGVIFAPQSPWWLVRQGRMDDAKKSLIRLTSQNCGVPFDADHEISSIIATNDHEVQLTADAGIMDCFKGTNLRRTEIVSMAMLVQTLCGFGLVSYCVVFLQRAGIDETDSFSFTVGIFGIGWVGTVGKRTLFLAGLAGMLVILVVIGALGAIDPTTGVSWAIGCLLLVLALVYDVSLGPLCFIIVAEIPATRLKMKSVSIARNVYNGFIITNIVVPKMLSVGSWNWGAKSGFFWAGMCLILFIWSYFRLPGMNSSAIHSALILDSWKDFCRDRYPF